MSKEYFIAALQIEKVDRFYLKITLGSLVALVHGDDLYFALVAALVGSGPENVPALTSSTTENEPKRSKNGHDPVVVEALESP